MATKMKIKDIELSIKELDAKEALDKLYSIREETGLSLDKLIAKYLKKKDAFDKEKARYDKMCAYEKDALKSGIEFIAGVDEAGRGPLAGPVVAAAVILPKGIFIEGLNDSKKLSHEKREKLFEIITKNALAYGIGMADEKCIDDINILNATIKAMEEAIAKLTPLPELILTDAVKLRNVAIRQLNIIRGDSLSVSIAAASVLAKVTRDRLICEMDNKYPDYGFANHKGYGTKDHIEAIKKFGICPIHRVSFTKNFVVT
ncbi:ribonuclease HII [Pseudobacteroides cellulosolvens]|uniref:Ribonuclease HII n=1 Tax=Pseudobacteroides cellulosolvens ATCC 35603 = DSM 2933 TaxID=398512 RepID=A0A0L6JHT8_9FIRM|nr:ribonuclease HII [Pseudobacteroides cellulosolvens]KNY25416.1 Ribonuclease HII [Pseudobacteroides cellulosolvens ATCC 35603 = DSM 2933]